MLLLLLVIACDFVCLALPPKRVPYQQKLDKLIEFTDGLSFCILQYYRGFVHPTAIRRY